MFRSAIVTDLETFRSETREWLEANCPDEMRNLSFHWEDALRFTAQMRPTCGDSVWQKRWIAPMWPAEYGGGGLSRDEAVVLSQEMQRIKATAASSGMGLTMIGPTLLEFGTEERAASLTQHLRWNHPLVSGCSEPRAAQTSRHCRPEQSLKAIISLLTGRKSGRPAPSTQTGCLRW